jgi:hypothetical protein
MSLLKKFLRLDGKSCANAHTNPLYALQTIRKPLEIGALGNVNKLFDLRRNAAFG